MQKALVFDPGGFSHALEMPIDWKKAPSLDDLTYGKGCAVVRMIARHVGKEPLLQAGFGRISTAACVWERRS
ncbi:hypothetical protein PZA11_003842 [Diplocarpon coronariae]